MRLGGARAVSGKKAAAATRGGGAVEAGPCLHSGGRVRTRNPARRRRRRHDGHGAFRGEFLGERRLPGTPRASASSRGLRARRAAALEASEREFAGPGAARPSSPRGPRLSGQRFPSGLAAAQGAGAGSAARQPRRGLPRARGAGRGGGDKAPTGRARRRVRGAGRPAGVCFPRRRPWIPRGVGARPGGLGTSSRARGWARGAAPRTLPPGLLTKPVLVALLGPSSFSPHPSCLPRGVLACSRCVPVMARTLEPPPPPRTGKVTPFFR